MRLPRRIRRDWAFLTSLLVHALMIGSVFARFQPAQPVPPPVRMEIKIAPIVNQAVAARPEPEQVVAAEPPPPVKAVEPEPELVHSTAPKAVEVAKRPPRRPKAVPALQPPPEPMPPRPVRQAMAAPEPRPARPVRAAAPEGPPVPRTPPGPPPDYLSKISAQLQRYKEYPRSARLRRIEGDVTLWFVIDRAGRVVDYRITQGSGHEVLDEAVDAMIHKASPFPPMPPSMAQAQLEITQPVTFRLH